VELLLDLTFYPVFAVFIGLEVFLSWRSQLQLYHFKDSFTNVTLSIFNGIVDLAVKGIWLFVLLYFNKYAFFHIQNVFLYWFLLFLGQDFCFWLLHYVDHKCRLFWAVHVTHHSSEKFNLTVAIRSSVFQPLYRPIYYIPLALMGFNGVHILFMFAVCNTYGFFIHTDMVGRLGFLEYIFATPSNHRVHHSSNVKYLDKNMGMVLIIWDRLFGTYQKEEEKPKYGLTKSIKNDNPFNVITYEWKNLAKDLKKPLTVRQKFMYIFGPPGWSHDGSSKTTRQLIEEAKIEAVSGEALVS